METLIQILELEVPLWAVLWCILFSIAMFWIYELFTGNYNWSRVFGKRKKKAKLVKLKNDWRPVTQHTSTT